MQLAYIGHESPADHQSPKWTNLALTWPTNPTVVHSQLRCGKR